ncbi:phytanoyl-CoA dioxygenase family protein [Kitasatospora acidiphila]|uniref:Phytanoyl-CoA dioxygenase family protein n=2 Tax=Kitasatospora acidiphila TaxID=2567942 RepID=A0A540WGU2_9ACTN|nr:phytanoyl-CoA dioxygenase family protein [Kitasatospora acidiphila]
MQPLLEDRGTVAAQRQQFTQSGYLVIPGLVPPPLVERLTAEVDHWVDDGLRARSIACCTDPARQGPPPVMELELPAHGELLTHQPLLELTAELLGAPFVFHHLHSDRHSARLPGKPWHHDREPNTRGDLSLTMVHALHYLGGLDDTMDSLVVLPGSQREAAEKSVRARLDTAELPGEVIVGRLPAGSTVLINSALFHARRPRRPRRPAATGAGKPRYFVDASYCQTGAQWWPVKPYWRHMLTRARELGLDGGRWPELFAERHFTEYADLRSPGEDLRRLAA